ncbi:MAG: hypothetical protein R2912_12745 [Eubacteriales bacterium]
MQTDISKLAITIPYFRSMRWIKPIRDPEAPAREEALAQSGGDPVL